MTMTHCSFGRPTNRKPSLTKITLSSSSIQKHRHSRLGHRLLKLCRHQPHPRRAFRMVGIVNPPKLPPLSQPVPTTHKGQAYLETALPLRILLSHNPRHLSRLRAILYFRKRQQLPVLHHRLSAYLLSRQMRLPLLHPQWPLLLSTVLGHPRLVMES